MFLCVYTFECVSAKLRWLSTLCRTTANTYICTTHAKADIKSLPLYHNCSNATKKFHRNCQWLKPSCKQPSIYSQLIGSEICCEYILYIHKYRYIHAHTYTHIYIWQKCMPHELLIDADCYVIAHYRQAGKYCTACCCCVLLYFICKL